MSLFLAYQRWFGTDVVPDTGVVGCERSGGGCRGCLEKGFPGFIGLCPRYHPKQTINRSVSYLNIFLQVFTDVVFSYSEATLRALSTTKVVAHYPAAQMSASSALPQFASESPLLFTSARALQ